jgi:hypothetical protein
MEATACASASSYLTEGVKLHQPLPDLAPTGECLGHHTFFSTLSRRQVLEEWCRYGGSIEPISVERNSLREEQLLQPLRVIERGLHPQI